MSYKSANKNTLKAQLNMIKYSVSSVTVVIRAVQFFVVQRQQFTPALVVKYFVYLKPLSIITVFSLFDSLSIMYHSADTFDFLMYTSTTNTVVIYLCMQTGYIAKVVP